MGVCLDPGGGTTGWRLHCCRAVFGCGGAHFPWRSAGVGSAAVKGTGMVDGLSRRRSCANLHGSMLNAGAGSQIAELLGFLDTGCTCIWTGWYMLLCFLMVMGQVGLYICGWMGQSEEVSLS